MSDLVYLVAVDGSEWSDRAAQRAVSLAKKTGAEVHFIAVITVDVPPIDCELIEKIEHDNVLIPLTERYAGSGVKFKTELHWGDPAEIIHDQAKKEHANMIFVGRRGRSKVGNLVMGSVANSLAHTAGVPVVLIP